MSMSNKKFDNYSKLNRFRRITCRWIQMDTYDIIKYILDTYSEYIDDLRIADLKNLLLKDSNIEENTNIWYSLRALMQLIVNECGVNIVND